jgi:FtsZ-binding cell division protein ZapB
MNIPLLTSLRSAFNWNEPDDAEMDKERIEKLRETMARGEQFEQMMKTLGYGQFVASINERLDSLRNQLENAKGDEVELLQARIKELKFCANIVNEELQRGFRAREELKELVK